MRNLFLKIIVGLILLVLFAPLLIIIVMSFTSASYFVFPPPSLSTRWYVSFFENDIWMNSLTKSLIIASLSTIISVVIGTMAANGVFRVKFPGKQIFMGLLIAPLVIPVIIIAIALYRFFAPFNLTGTTLGIVLSHSLMAIPIVFITILARLKGMDKNLELAAIGLGTTPFGAFMRITVPYLKPALYSSIVLAFIVSFDEVIITIFMSGPGTKTLPVRLWENLHTIIDPTIAAISTILIVVIIVIYTLQEWFKFKKE